MNEQSKSSHCSSLRDGKCPNEANHTYQPNGYLQWHEWAKTKIKTHKQVRCFGCGLYQIWVKKMKEVVFSGSETECQDFVRANRFNVLLSGMEIREGKVYAFRNDKL